MAGKPKKKHGDDEFDPKEAGAEDVAEEELKEPGEFEDDPESEWMDALDEEESY